MKESNDIEKNIESLERELRGMGEPYSKGMPGDAYFADFQSRLMARIASEQVVAVPQKNVSFVRSPMRITALVGAVALLVAGFFYMNRSENTEVPTTNQTPVLSQTQTSIEPTTLADTTIKQSVSSTKDNIRSPKDTNPARIVESPKAPIVKQPEATPLNSTQSDIVSVSPSFEDMDELSVGDPESPVTYDKLSVDELESVLRILESNEFESER